MEVVFHVNPHDTRELRRWDKFHSLADHLIEKHGANIKFVGVESDKEYIDSILLKTKGAPLNMAGQTSLNDLVGLLKKCDLLICVNSFVMHLGVCLGVKMVAIVGATHPSIILPHDIPHLYSRVASDIPLESVIEKIEEVL